MKLNVFAILLLVVGSTGCFPRNATGQLGAPCKVMTLRSLDGWVIADVSSVRRDARTMLVGTARQGDYGVPSFAMVDVASRDVAMTRSFDQTAEAGFDSVVSHRTGWTVAGTTRGVGSRGEEDAWIIHVDVYGDVTHSAFFGGPYTDHSSAVVKGSEHGVWLVGTTRSKGAGDGSSAWLVALNPSLETEWERTYGDAVWQGFDDAVAWQGGLLAVGWQRPDMSRPSSVWLVHVDASGAIRWQRTWTATSTGRPVAIGHRETSGNFWLVGRRQQQGWVGRYDVRGSLMTERTFGPSSAGQVALVSRAWTSNRVHLVAGSVIRTHQRSGWAGFFIAGIHPQQESATLWSRVHRPGIPLTAHAISRDRGQDLIMSYGVDGTYRTDIAALDANGSRLDCGRVVQPTP